MTNQLKSHELQPGVTLSSWRALALYLVVSLIMTWPLALHLTDRAPGGANDLFQNLWNFWWWSTALLERGQLPYVTDLMFQAGVEPQPISLAFHTHSEANILSMFPVLAVAGVVAAMNLALLASFVLSAWGAYLLARELGASSGGAFVGGLVFAYFPQHIEQGLEHINLASYQGMPFFLLFLLRVLHSGGATNIIGCALCFALNALYSWHNALMILPLALILFGHTLTRTARSRSRVLGECVAAALLAAVVLGPFLVPKFVEISRGEDYFAKPAVLKGVDALFLFVPALDHALWGEWLSGVYDRYRSYGSVGFTCYLGWVPLFFALFAGGAVRASGRAALRFSALVWFLLFGLNVVLALGDELVVAGNRTGIPLLHEASRQVPGFSMLRVANRFMVPAMLALSVLSALGATRLLATGRAVARPVGWAAVLSILVLLDFAWLPFPLRELPQPAWPAVVAQNYPGLILNIPGGYRARAADDLYLQTQHGQPIVGGYTSCVLPEVKQRVGELPFLKFIFEGRPTERPADIDTGLQSVLSALAVDTVIVHRGRDREALAEQRAAVTDRLEKRRFNPDKGMPRADLQQVRAAVRQLWGEPIYSDDDVEIFRRR